MRDLVDLGAGDADDGEEVAVGAAAAVRKQRRAVEAARRRRCCIHVDGQEVKWADAPTRPQGSRALRGAEAAAEEVRCTAAGARVDGGGDAEAADLPLPSNPGAACSTALQVECMISSVVLTVVLPGGAETEAEYRQWRNIIL
jgi:hypothetical protein